MRAPAAPADNRTSRCAQMWISSGASGQTPTWRMRSTNARTPYSKSSTVQPFLKQFRTHARLICSAALWIRMGAFPEKMAVRPEVAKFVRESLSSNIRIFSTFRRLNRTPSESQTATSIIPQCWSVSRYLPVPPEPVSINLAVSLDHHPRVYRSGNLNL